MMKVLKAVKVILNTISKIFLVIAVFVVIINLFLHFTSQNKPKVTVDPIKQNREEIYKVINDPKLSKTKEGKLSIVLYRSMTCGMIGEACTKNPEDGDKNFNKSLFGFMTNLVVLPYANPPASGIYYVYDGLNNAGFVPKTYAAEGIGFAALRPFMNLWKVFRDVAYLILVLVLVAIGFLIMFRMKINPQTVISIENALPKIVISLILITFSFAIAGFLIDLMYVVIGIGISILSKNTIININAKDYIDKIYSANGWRLFDSVFWNADILKSGYAIMGILPSIIAWTIRVIGATAIFIFLRKVTPLGGLLEGTIIGDIPVAGDFLVWLLQFLISTFVTIPLSVLLVPLLISLLVFLTALLIFFRIFFMLITTYIQTLLLIIFSPVLLLLEAVPGKSVFSYWFKNLLVNLLIFPVVAILIIVSSIITAIPSASGNFWRAPFLYDLNPNDFSILVGLGLLFMIPDLVKALKELLGAKGLPVSFGVGTFFAGAATGVGGALGLAGQYGSLAMAFPGLRKQIGKILPAAKDWVEQ